MPLFQRPFTWPTAAMGGCCASISLAIPSFPLPAALVLTPLSPCWPAGATRPTWRSDGRTVFVGGTDAVHVVRARDGASLRFIGRGAGGAARNGDLSGVHPRGVAYWDEEGIVGEDADNEEEEEEE